MGLVLIMYEFYRQCVLMFLIFRYYQGHYEKFSCLFTLSNHTYNVLLCSLVNRIRYSIPKIKKEAKRNSTTCFMTNRNLLWWYYKSVIENVYILVFKRYRIRVIIICGNINSKTISANDWRIKWLQRSISAGRKGWL